MVDYLKQFEEKHRPLLNFASKSIFFALLGSFVVIAWVRGGVDFRGYYSAALLVREGGNPYDYAQLASILEEITGFKGNNPYFYPPWYCLFFTPLTFFSFQTARLLWLFFNAILFYLSLDLLKNALNWRINGWRRWGVYLFSAILFAFYCLVSEQAGILLLFGAALILQGLKKNLPALTGAGLIILASKPQITILAIIFMSLWLLFRQAAAIVWAVTWGVALLGIASLAIPGWWAFDYKDFGKGLTYQLDGTEEVVALRINSTVYDFLSYTFTLSSALQYAIAVVIGVAGAALVIFVWHKYNRVVP